MNFHQHGDPHGQPQGQPHNNQPTWPCTPALPTQTQKNTCLSCMELLTCSKTSNACWKDTRLGLQPLGAGTLRKKDASGKPSLTLQTPLSMLDATSMILPCRLTKLKEILREHLEDKHLKTTLPSTPRKELSLTELSLSLAYQIAYTPAYPSGNALNNFFLKLYPF